MAPQAYIVKLIRSFLNNFYYLLDGLSCYVFLRQTACVPGIVCPQGIVCPSGIVCPPGDRVPWDHLTSNTVPSWPCVQSQDLFLNIHNIQLHTAQCNNSYRDNHLLSYLITLNIHFQNTYHGFISHSSNIK